MAAASKYTIYALTDKAGDVRYVGWATNTQRRLRTHIHQARKEPLRNHRTNWIHSLLKVGLKPSLVVIETGNGCDWGEKERGWIKFFRERGCRLVNATDGGDGSLGYKHSSGTLAKMAKARIGRVFSLEHRARLSEARLGHEVSPETRAKIGAASRGQSPESRLKMSASKLGHAVSAETRAKIGDANKGQIPSPEERANMSIAQRRRRATERAA